MIPRSCFLSIRITPFGQKLWSRDLWKIDQIILITPYHSDIWFRVQSLQVKITRKGVFPQNQEYTSGDWSPILVPRDSLCPKRMGTDPLIKILERRDQSLTWDSWLKGSSLSWEACGLTPSHPDHCRLGGNHHCDQPNLGAVVLNIICLVKVIHKIFPKQDKKF